MDILYTELKYNRYEIGESIRFGISEPKPREVWAANFRDRIVQHLVYNRISKRFIDSFIDTTYACIPGRGTHYGANNLHKQIRKASNNWTKEVHYLKCDFKNFFYSINKIDLYNIIKKKIKDKNILNLIYKIIFNNPLLNYVDQMDSYTELLIPEEKKLKNLKDNYGLPIGNITSQLFANIYLNDLDHFIKRDLKVKYYSRYVDDFVVLGSKEDLSIVYNKILLFLNKKCIYLNKKKTIKHSVYRGVDFIGFISKPNHLEIRKSIMNKAVYYNKIKDYKKVNIYKNMLKNGNNHNKRRKLQRMVQEYL